MGKAADESSGWYCFCGRSGSIGTLGLLEPG